MRDNQKLLLGLGAVAIGFIGWFGYTHRSRPITPADVPSLHVGDRLRFEANAGGVHIQTEIEVISNDGNGHVIGKVIAGPDAGKGPVDVGHTVREALLVNGTVTKL